MGILPQLTGLADHLMDQGHDVRWYAQGYFTGKFKKLNIPHYLFVPAQQINQFDLLP